jgi:hypothetical protein
MDDVQAARLDPAVNLARTKTQRNQLPMRHRAMLPIRELGEHVVT